MSNEIQNTLKAVEEAIQALYFVDMDAVRETLRQELLAEVKDEIRQEIIDEIRAELSDAVEAANEDDAPEIGTETTWGQDDAPGLGHFLAMFDLNW